MRPPPDTEPEEEEEESGDTTVFLDRGAFAEEADSVPHLKSGDESKGSQHPVTPLPKVGETVRIGRDPTNTIILQQKAVSRFHAEVVARDGSYLVNNWKSTNGTFVNGQKIESHVLQAGDKIEVGEYDILFDGKQLLLLGIRPPPAPKEEDTKNAPPTPARAARWLGTGLLVAVATFMMVSRLVEEAGQKGPHPLTIVISGQVALQPNDANLAAVDLSVGFPDLRLVVAVPKPRVEWHYDGSYVVRLSFQSPRTPHTARLSATRKGYGDKHVDDLKLGGQPLSCRVPKIELKALEPTATAAPAR